MPTMMCQDTSSMDFWDCWSTFKKPDVVQVEKRSEDSNVPRSLLESSMAHLDSTSVYSKVMDTQEFETAKAEMDNAYPRLASLVDSTDADVWMNDLLALLRPLIPGAFRNGKLTDAVKSDKDFLLIVSKAIVCCSKAANPDVKNESSWMYAEKKLVDTNSYDRIVCIMRDHYSDFSYDLEVCFRRLTSIWVQEAGGLEAGDLYNEIALIYETGGNDFSKTALSELIMSTLLQHQQPWVAAIAKECLTTSSPVSEFCMRIRR